MSWIPVKISEKAALQDQPGAAPHRNSPYLREENQIMAEGVVPLGGQEQGGEMGKE